MLSGSIGIAAGSITLSGLCFELTKKDHDPDFFPFIGIASDCAHIPFGKVRERWSSKGLEKIDRELEELENSYKEMVLSACNKIIARFENDSV